MHARHPHVRMAAEAALEAALVLGLDLVVELVGDPLAHLGQHRAGVEPGREALEDRADERRGCAGRPRRLGHARVLHLDRDLVPSSVRARWTWPSEASANGSSSKSANSSRTRRVEVLLDDASHAVEGDRRRARGQRAERARRALALELRASRGTARASRPRPSSARAGRRAPRPARGPARRRATALAHPAAHDGLGRRGRRDGLVPPLRSSLPQRAGVDPRRLGRVDEVAQHAARSAAGRRGAGSGRRSGKTSSRLPGTSRWAARACSTGMIGSRSPQTIRNGIAWAR